MTRLRRLHPALAACLAAALLAAACSKSDSGPTRAKAPGPPIDLSTAGAIQVQVDYTGPAPSPAAINMAGTPACAAMHPQPVPDQSLVVNAGHLANAVVYIKSGLGDRGFAAPETPVVLDQRGCLYAPHVAAVMEGQPLEFRNSDAEAHNVHGRPQTADGWNFLMSRPGSTRDVTIDKPEVGIPVGCDIHPWMRAYVSVFDHPYFAVTGGDGAATLKPLPPGPYEVAVWHETLGTLVQPVTVAPNGTATVRFAFPPRS